MTDTFKRFINMEDNGDGTITITMNLSSPGNAMNDVTLVSSLDFDAIFNLVEEKKDSDRSLNDVFTVIPDNSDQL